MFGEQGTHFGKGDVCSRAGSRQATSVCWPELSIRVHFALSAKRAATGDLKLIQELSSLPRQTNAYRRFAIFPSTIRIPRTLHIRRYPPTQRWLTLLPNHSPVSYRPSKAKLDSTSRPASGSLSISLKVILLQVIAPDASCKRDKMKV